MLMKWHDESQYTVRLPNRDWSNIAWLFSKISCYDYNAAGRSLYREASKKDSHWVSITIHGANPSALFYPGGVQNTVPIHQP